MEINKILTKLEISEEDFVAGMKQGSWATKELTKELKRLALVSKKMTNRRAHAVNLLMKEASVYTKVQSKILGVKNITDALQTSLTKRKGFDINKQFDFAVSAQNAKNSAKAMDKNQKSMVKAKYSAQSLISVTNALQTSLAKRGSFDVSKQLRFDVIAQSAKNASKQIVKNQRAMDKAKRSALTLTGVLSKMRGASLMMGLGMLFFGMQMQRTFHAILKGAVSTFNRIMQESNMLGTATQRLAVHWEYLKFTIGHAINAFLEPLMPVIERIISAVTDWINKHPDLTAKILLTAAAVGTLLFALGVILTPMGSFITNMANLTKIIPAFGAGVAKIKWLPLILGLAGAAAVSALFFKVLKDNKNIGESILAPMAEDMVASLVSIKVELDEIATTILPQFDSAWSATSGIIMWIFDLFAHAVKLFLNQVDVYMTGVSAIVKGAEVVREAWKYAFSFGVYGDLSKAKTLLQGMKKDFLDIGQAIKDDTKNTIEFDKVLLTGPKSLAGKIKTFKDSADKGTSLTSPLSPLTKEQLISQDLIDMLTSEQEGNITNFYVDGIHIAREGSGTEAYEELMELIRQQTNLNTGQ